MFSEKLVIMILFSLVWENKEKMKVRERHTSIVK